MQNVVFIKKIPSPLEQHDMSISKN